MKLTEIREILAAEQIRLTQSLGQNFLHDGNQLRRITAAAELTREDQVLEIGPGLGALTAQLIRSGARVLAIEKDRRLLSFLQRRWPQEPHLTLHHADALDYLRRHSGDWRGWKLVANLPYSVGSSILVELAQAKLPPERMVATLQLEVGKRLMAQAGQPDYGLLSLLIQLRFEPGRWFKISAGCFYPAPEVDSACVVLLRRSRPLLDPARCVTFEKIVRRSLSQRRKTVLKLLKADWPAPELEQAFAELELSPQVRGEAIRLEQYIRLAERLHDFMKPDSK